MGPGFWPIQRELTDSTASSHDISYFEQWNEKKPVALPHLGPPTRSASGPVFIVRPDNTQQSLPFTRKPHKSQRRQSVVKQ